MKRRAPVNKMKSTRSFRKQSGKTNKKNLGTHPMRGGFRL